MKVSQAWRTFPTIVEMSLKQATPHESHTQFCYVYTDDGKRVPVKRKNTVSTRSVHVSKAKVLKFKVFSTHRSVPTGECVHQCHWQVDDQLHQKRM